MGKDGIDDQDNVSILALEYSSLRNNINTRMSGMFNVGSLGVAVGAIVFHTTSGDSLDLIIVFLVTVLLIAELILWYDITRAGLRAQQIETEINRRARERLLIWETDLGGLSGNYWKSDLLRLWVHHEL